MLSYGAYFASFLQRLHPFRSTSVFLTEEWTESGVDIPLGQLGQLHTGVRGPTVTLNQIPTVYYIAC